MQNEHSTKGLVPFRSLQDAVTVGGFPMPVVGFHDAVDMQSRYFETLKKGLKIMLQHITGEKEVDVGGYYTVTEPTSWIKISWPKGFA